MRRSLGRGAVVALGGLLGYTVLRFGRERRTTPPLRPLSEIAAAGPVTAAAGFGSGPTSPPARLPSRLLTIAAGFGLLLVVAGAAAGPRTAMHVAPLVAILAIVTATSRRLFRWDTLIGLLMTTIFLIPIKRYTIPGNAFNLEPYRLLVAALAAGWCASLLADRRVQFRRSGFEGPIGLFVFAALASVAANNGRIQTLGVEKDVVKTLTFFASFFIIFYLVVSVVRSSAEIHKVVKTIVICASLVAASAIVESRTHFNVFNHLHPLLPGLQYNDPALTAGLTPAYLDRSGVLRVYASSAHPIELSAVLVMVIPLAVYLIKATGQRRWILSIFLLALASFATLSRTGIIMMFVTVLVFLWLRPVETRRLWPMAVPIFLAVSIALPHTIGSFYAAFFPKGGLVAQQDERNVGSDDGGRLTDIGPSLREYSQKPLLGEGFGSRITQRLGVENSIKTTARILDDQWLGSLLETGAVGVIALLWLFIRPIRRLSRRAKADDGPEGWLAAALTASLYSFAVAMLTFDAFGFIQVTILTFVLLALAASVLRTPFSGAATVAPR